MIEQEESSELHLAKEKQRLADQTADFLRKAIEQNPGFSVDMRLIGLTVLLLELGLKDKALGIIEELVQDKEFRSSWNNKLDREILGKLFARVGKFEQAREHFAVYEKTFRDERYNHKEDLIGMTSTYFEEGLVEEGKRLVIECASWMNEGPDSVFMRRNIHHVLEMLTKSPELREEALEVWQLYEQQAIKFAVSQIEEEPQNRDVSYAMGGLFDVLETGQALSVESTRIETIKELLFTAIGKLDVGYLARYEYSTREKAIRAIKSKQLEIIPRLIEVANESSVAKLINLAVAAELIETGDRENGLIYLEQAGLIEGDLFVNTEMYVDYIRVYCLLGQQEKIPGVLEQFLEAGRQNPRYDVERDMVLQIVEALCKYDLVDLAEKFAYESLLNKYYVRQHYDLMKIAGAFGIAGRPALLSELLAYTEPTERLSVLLGNPLRLEQDFNVSAVMSHIGAKPSGMSFDQLLPFLINMSEQDAWTELQDYIKNAPVENEQQLIDKIAFLMLEYGSLHDVRFLISILRVLKEKISVDRIDNYRALMGTPHLKKLMTSGRAEWVIWLAHRNIITEAKHLFYFDVEATVRIEALIAHQSEEKVTGILEFLSRILKEKTTHLSSVLHCAQTLQLDLTDPQVQTQLFEAIDILGGVTPIIFKNFQKLALEERPAFVAGIEKLRKVFYQNVNLTPELLGLPEEDFEELLAEYITVLFKPVGFSADQVLTYMRQIKGSIGDRDLTAELRASIKFGGEHWHEEEGCYIVDIEVEEMQYKWKEGKPVAPVAKALTFILGTEITTLLNVERTSLDRLRIQAFQSLLKSKGAFHPTESRLKTAVADISRPAALAALLSFLPLKAAESLGLLDAALRQNDATALQTALTRAREVLGTKTDVGYEMEDDVVRSWKIGVSEWFDKLEPLSQDDIRRQLGEDVSTTAEAVDKLYEALELYALPKIASILTTEERKLEVKGSTEIVKKIKRVRFYPSKNLASFFAKASSGICTSGDIDLFVREDHYHLNMVDDETGAVIGNIQIYLPGIDHQIAGKTVVEILLMERGINPTIGFVTPGNVKGIVKASMLVGEEMAASGGMSKFVFSESLNGWHADSNRPEVGGILRKHYLRGDNILKLPKPYSLTGRYEGTQIEKVHVQWVNPSARTYIDGEDQAETSNPNAWQRFKQRLSGMRRIFWGTTD